MQPCNHAVMQTLAAKDWATSVITAQSKHYHQITFIKGNLSANHLPQVYDLCCI